MNMAKEFEKQLNTLLQKGYPKAANKSPEEFIAIVDPLKKQLEGLSLIPMDIENGTLPFVIVIKNDLVPTEDAMQLVDKAGKNGITKLYPHTPADFQTIENELIPQKDAYLLLNIDRGKSTRNVSPNEALKQIRVENRSPLSIDEGIAIVTQYPEFLIKNNCFSLLASRHQGDQRVPAIWINGNKNPNLGWCWDGNPHTWLGSASCERRI